MKNSLIIRQLGVLDYTTVWRAMQQFTDSRIDEIDELWLVEHPAVFTQGQAGKPEHVIDTGDIPVVHADRGGQVTYHGPGQLIAYVLIDLKRKGIGVRDLVSALENAVVEVLQHYKIDAYPKPDAPGVYVNEMKISSLGLRVRRGCSFHGLALNVDMDLTPFLRINPCGYAGLEMVQTCDLGGPNTIESASKSLIKHLTTLLHAENINYITGLDQSYDH